MKHAPGRTMAAAIAAVLTLATGLGVVTAAPAPADTTVSGPVTGGNGTPSALTSAFDLGQVGYQQSEFFLSGTAHAYTPTGPIGPDGRWSVAPSSDAQYTTRVIVHRPTDPAKFNGTVFVEWLNVSIGSDVGVDWGFGHNEIIRRGAAWVGVSAQSVGVEAAKSADPVRYSPLVHPGDSYSYDMFTQAGQAIRNDAGTLLGGLKPQRLIATGESQSAGRMVTYVDAIQPLEHAFDGFLIHSRGSSGAPISQLGTPTVMPATAMIRTDNTAPVLVLQSETDVTPGGRQDDSPTYRLWEMAGTSHVDAYTIGIGLTDTGNGQGDAAMFAAMQNPPSIGCAAPVNTGPSHWLVETALRRLTKWVKLGIAPPVAPRLDVSTFTPVRTYARDANGNVLGGIRTPWVDAPVAVVTNDGQSGPGLLCRLSGATFPFDSTKLHALYPTHDTFVTRWRQAANRAVKAGFLLGVDARTLNRVVASSTIPN